MSKETPVSIKADTGVFLCAKCVIISTMKVLREFLLALLLALTPVGSAFAQSSSTNYSVEESSFGSGSGTGNSTSYEAQVSAGDNAVGSAYSTSYGAYAGPISPNEEYLEMVVTAASIDLDTASEDPGILTSTETATGTGSFYVRTYLNSSYAVVTLSSSMINESGDTILPLSSPTAATAGVEQFGINLVNNATPNIGADPVPDPSSTYANGEAATGYDTADLFKYAQSDVIAQNGGNPAWGQTAFTISYIVNISDITEAGYYQMVHELTTISTF